MEDDNQQKTEKYKSITGIVTKMYMGGLFGSDPFLVLNNEKKFFIYESDFIRVNVGDKVRITYSLERDPAYWRGDYKIKILQRGS